MTNILSVCYTEEGYKTDPDETWEGSALCQEHSTL